MIDLVPTLPCEVVRWVADEPNPRWIEVVFVDALGEDWHFFDKSHIFESSNGPLLTKSPAYPVDIRHFASSMNTQDRLGAGVARAA